MTEPSHVIVISHRRSGTHLTIDTIRNNFEAYRQLPYFNLDRISIGNSQRRVSLAELKEELEKGPRVIKTHYLPDFKNVEDADSREFIEKLFKESKKIYIARNGKDVMVSLLHYFKGFKPGSVELSFSDFLRMPHDFDPVSKQMTRPEFWQYHIEQWFTQPYGETLALEFSQLKNDYDEVVKRISDFVGLPHDPEIRDVRRSKVKAGLLGTFKEKFLSGRGKVAHTSVAFRSGKVGDNEEYFTPEDDKFFMDEAPRATMILDKLANDN